ncbi:hypothetical protein PanWU01x14_369120 [Parasponia andersonii]|uniref:Uncharacterized protein n=1 Tax=Parasponia andersonii TaxID=3476 RepID=A0A2P5A4R9_PARAD|nr:hypothetical protein PanWU01x14_369120 [Parasponia andersonii]
MRLALTSMMMMTIMTRKLTKMMMKITHLHVEHVIGDMNREEVLDDDNYFEGAYISSFPDAASTSHTSEDNQNLLLALADVVSVPHVSNTEA